MRQSGMRSSRFKPQMNTDKHRSDHLLPRKRRAIAYGRTNLIFRRLDQGPKGRVERPSLHDKPIIVERRSLRSALRAPVETTEAPYAIALPASGGGEDGDRLGSIRVYL